MLQYGVIQLSVSEWSSALVLIRKKYLSVRYWIYYHSLNAKTMKDTFQLPHIEESLDMLQGVPFYSMLNMASGYWQLELEPEDRHKAAFITKHGLFEHVKMGFGLCNVPATFEHTMNLVLSGLTWKSVISYLDDIIVLGNSYSQSLMHLEQVFQRLRQYCLKLKPRKCQLFQTSVTFLGRQVDPSGICIKAEKYAGLYMA